MGRKPGRNKFFKTEDGRTFLNLPSAKKHVRIIRGEKATIKGIADLMKHGGAELVYKTLIENGLLRKEKSADFFLPEDFNVHPFIEKLKTDPIVELKS